MSRVLLLRHGETDWNRVNRIQGWEDVSLNDRGREQARAAARFLAAEFPGLGRILSSDLPRAAETAAIVSAEAFEHLEVEHHAAWRERDFGVYQGQSGDQFFQENPEFSIRDGKERAKRRVPEDGESYQQFRDRVHAAWSTLTGAVETPVLVVTHSGVIRAVITAIEEVGIERVFPKYDVENGSLTEIVVEGGPRLERVNHVEHLATE